MMNWIPTPVVVFTWLAMLVGASHAADQDGLAAKAQEILKTNCYRCHGQDGTIEGGLNYILDVKTLIARKKIIPGDADRSKLLKRVRSQDNPMPPAEEKVRPSREDMATLEAWIRAGAGPVQPNTPRRTLVSDADVLTWIARDLYSLEERHRPYARYFTLTHLHGAGLSEDELQTHRHGLAKLLNSLSWEPDIVVPRPVDPAQTILRIDLRAFRWDARLWKRLLDDYPYGILYPSGTARFVARATACELPYVRADWFVFAASRPPLYHDILQLPRTDLELERELRVDVAADIREERIARAAFNSSGVSRNNRLIERHKTGHGAYWKSYDFAGNTGRQNLFAHPFGPGPAPDTFQQDGGEIIFNLPNGLQAYMLVDGRGNRIDEGPTKIVSVKNQTDPTVINGVSCMFCHARGLIDKTDQIRSHVAMNPSAFTEAEARLILALYPTAAEFKALLDKDADRFRRAVAATGTKLGSTEPVVALAGRFESELDLVMAAAELGLSPAALLRGLDGFPHLAALFGALKVEGGTVQRQVFAGAFPDLVNAFIRGRSLFALNKALARVDETLRRHPHDAAAHLERGNLHLDKGVFDEAVRDYGEALRLGAPGAEAHRNRGMAHAFLGAYDKAIADYGAALRIDPDHAATYHNRGLAHAARAELDEALADFDLALRLDKDNAAVYSARGLVLTRKGAYERAILDYTEALRLRPWSAALHVRRGEAYSLNGASGSALSDYDRALQLNPRLFEAYLRRAALNVSLGRYTAAVKDYIEVVRQLDPTSP